MSAFSYAVLGSGSKANSYIFSDSNITILIDNGFSCAQAIKRINEAGFNPTEINYIFVTHGHSDHTKGVPLLSQRFRIPVYVHPEVSFGEKRCYHRTPLLPHEIHTDSSFSISSFPSSHDSPGCVGYFFTLGGKKVVIITDTGITTKKMLELARKSDILFLEANYCSQMLRDGSYPVFLKQRIESSQGHLSNLDSVEFLNSVLEGAVCQLKKVYFCHLSETNNTPERLQYYLEMYYKGTIPYTICPKNLLIKGDHYGEKFLL